jgi:UDP-N-acetyl-D-mannosaminuronic acid dehydrogenase
MPEFQQIVVIGLGYIGLPTAAVIASRGLRVIGVDVNEDVVRTVASGAIHIAEPDLDGLVQKVVSNGSLTVSTKLVAADVFMIAVPTPIDADKRPDLRSVIAAIDSLVDVLQPGNLVILESTSPVGTTEEMAKRIVAKRPDLRIAGNESLKNSISIAYCPERVLPGRILTELINNDRCIGGITPHCARRAQRFYKSFIRGACIATTARAAEMVKLTENAFRDTNIAFANELSLICDRYGINVWEVIDLANRHPRVNVLRPGPGVGGHCVAIDPWFIVHSAPDLARIIRTGREINDSRIGATVSRAVSVIEDHPYADVAVCGLAFKANVDDLRESPALEIASQLSARYGSRIKIVEPYIDRLPPILAENGAELMELDQAIHTCEVAVVLVDHDQFKMIPLAERRHLAVIDTRGIWQDMPTAAREEGEPSTLYLSEPYTKAAQK